MGSQIQSLVDLVNATSQAAGHCWLDKKQQRDWSSLIKSIPFIPNWGISNIQNDIAIWVKGYFPGGSKQY